MRYPLSGFHLIEASAGTGKTYTISCLFVRLLIEKKLDVGQILVVTYTKAATEDLRIRVRQMVQNCLLAFESGKGKDDFETQLLEREINHEKAAKRLLSALQNFDEAAIFTIHAFCQKMLRENSLESGALFDTELVPDLDDVLYEVAADFWRRQVERFPPSFLTFARGKLQPEALFSLLKKVRPGLLFLPLVKEGWLDAIMQNGDLLRLEQEVGRNLQRLFDAWPSAKNEVRDLLCADPSPLNKNSYKPDKIPVWLAEMEVFCTAHAPYRGALTESFEKFTSQSLCRATKKKGIPPSHPFFDICQDVYDAHSGLQDLFHRCLIAVQQEAAAFAMTEFDLRKNQKNVFAYDDLLNRLQQGLQGPHRQFLMSLIRNRFPAALIDEFQDTDPVQYDIFSTLYRNGQGSLLYIIGDPKQAIYSFRGADIFAYMKAGRDVDSQWALEHNYRSEPGLVRAVNTLFSAADNPFLFREIAFSGVAAADIKKRNVLTINGCREAPFQLWQIRRRNWEKKLLNKQDAKDGILAPLAAEICRLLSLGVKQKALIGDRPLCPMDIAVLVRENSEAQLVQKALAEKGVASVVQSADDLFASREALQLQCVLDAVAFPGDERAVRAAVSTDILAGSCFMFKEFEQDEEKLSRWFTVFGKYHKSWQEKGFISLFRRLLEHENVREQLLRFDDGERRLTNLLHLGEALHQYEHSEKASMALMRAWLADRISGRQKSVEEYQLRLESDGERVQIVTIHRSKGLQYPVVFCPFTWSGVRNPSGAFSFHLRDDDNRPALDLGSAEQDFFKELAKEEELAENMRLLYVALTRAINRCYLVWGGFNGAESSALAWLLRGQDDLAALKKRFKNITDDQIAAELQDVVNKSQGTIHLAQFGEDEPGVAELPAGQESVDGCPLFDGKVVRNLQVSSFSAIARMTSHEKRKMLAGPDEKGASEENSIFSFPKGAGPGVFMHEIFEHLDFTLVKSEPDICRELILKKLTAYRFDEKWLAPIWNMVKNVLSVPLLPDSEFALQNVGMESRLNELEFYFPLSAVRARSVGTLFSAFGMADATASSLEFATEKGFLKGFIDLVFEHNGRFYIVDWKSNFLGFDKSCYQSGLLQEVMVREKYILQYLLYSIALHQYLQQRLAKYHFEEHFGGVFYVFLRGVQAEQGSRDYGIFYDRPDAGLVAGLSETLVAQEWK